MSKRILRLALLPVCLAAVACRSGHLTDNHWNADGVPERVVKHFTGYRQDVSGSYVQHQWRKKMDIDLTLRRHFLNNNPDNPYQPDDPSQVRERPPHSLFPDPIYYFHVESLATGAVMSGWTGAFIPIPVDSLVATFAGGWDEFGEGFSSTFSDEGGEERDQPPRPSKFRVKNR